MTLNLTSPSSGAGYFTLLAGSGATCGTAAQTAAGEDSTGTAVIHGSLTLTANTVGVYTVRNLSQNTPYTACFTPDGSSAPLSSTVTTTAAISFTSPSWQAVGNLGFSASTANYESIAFAPTGTPYLAYIDGSASNKVTVAKYNGASWVTVGTAGFTPGPTAYLSLAFAPDGTPYVAFQDNSNSGSFNGPVSVMKFNGTSWGYVGAADFSSGGAAYNSLAFAPDGSPYVAFSDGNNNSAATVMRFNGTSWVVVGSAAFSTGSAAFVSLAFTPTGTPYVAYQDGGTTVGATVQKFSGGVWTTVGTAGFSSSGSSTALYESLAFAPGGSPYVAFEDSNNSNKASVMMFNGSSWSHIGSSGITSSAACCESLALAPDGTLYLAYADVSSSRKVSVQQFNGSAWNIIGNAAFTNTLTLYVSLAVSPNGTPYVAYRDGGNSGKASVMALVGSGPSAATGSATSVTATGATLNGTVNDNGSATTVTFDYGTTSSYGTNVAATTGGSIAAGTGATASSVSLTGLTPGTTYHFRVDATANGTTVNGADATFTTPAVPVVTSISPTTGPAAGGTTVTVNGTGFTGATIVSFGSTAAASYTVVSATQITAVSPAGTGTVDIVVTTQGASSATSTADQFTYNPPITGTIATANLGAGQVTLQLTSSATGTGYFTLLLGATCGTAAQTVAGQDSTGAAAYRFGSLPLTAATTGNYTVSNLFQSTGYKVCFTPDGVTAPVSANVTTIAMTTFPNPGWDPVGNAGFSAGAVSYTQLAFAPTGNPYVAYQDSNNAYKATVMQFTQTGWIPLGNAGFSTGAVNNLSFALSPDGTPYVVYSDSANSYKATVMKYSLGSWIPVGSSAGFSSGIANYPSLAFGPDGTPYVAYEDTANNYKATVMKYSSGSWTPVGPSAGFSLGEANFLSLAFGPDGTPYVAYEDYGSSYKATVMKYSSGSWTLVGPSAGFSTGTATYLSLAFGPDGAPYLTYADGGNSNKAMVMKYSSGAWAPVGPSTGFSTGAVYWNSLAFSPNGTPYVAYRDGGNGNYATVMMYNGTSWVTAGNGDFSAGGAVYTSLAFSVNGIPSVAYSDAVNSGKATMMYLGNAGPSATTGTATAITSSSATLNGTVNDNGSATTVTFDYGTTSSYGTNLAATTGGSIAAGTGNTASSVGISGLSPNTTYHFRVNATANGTTVNGADATFTTNLATPTVTTWPTASAITYGQTLSSSNLTGGAASVPGTFAWTTPLTQPATGTASFSVTFTPTNTNTYTTLTNNVSVTTNQATPTVTWSNPTAITYGTALSATQLNARVTGVGNSTLAGTYTYSPASGTVLNAGSNQTLSLTFTPADTTDYTTVTTTVSINVNTASQTITFAQPATPVTYGVSPIALSATASSNLTPTFSVVSGPGTVSGSTLTVLGAGTIVLSANQPGNANYQAASQVTRSIVVNQATPTVAWSNPAAITYGTALSSTQLNATATGVSGNLAGTFAYTPASGITLNAGNNQTLSVTFTPTDTTDYTTVTKTGSINVNPATQTITFAQPASPVTYGALSTVPLSATGGASGNAVTFSVVSGPGTLSGSTLTITGAGTIVLSANQLGNANYGAATQVQQTLVVNKALSTLTGPTQTVFVVNGQSGSIPVSLAGQYSGPGVAAPSGSINYAITNSSASTVASGSLPASNGTVNIPVASSYAPGIYSVATSYAGDGNYSAAATITTQVQVGQIQPTITWTAAPSINYGTPLAGILTAQAYNGSNPVAGTYSYSIGASTVTSATVLAAGSYTLTVTFTPVDTTTYKSATATAALLVNKAAVGSATLTSSVNPLLVQNATVLTASVASSVSTPTGTVTFLDGTTPLGSAALTGGVASLSVSTLAVGTHSITAVYSGDANFLAATSGVVSELVQDFTLGLTASGSVSQTVLPGGTAAYSFNLAPVGGPTFPSSVSLSVTGLPAGATYTITPQTIASGSSTTPVGLSITVPQQIGSNAGEKPFQRSLAPIALGLLLLPFSTRLRRRAGKLTRLAAMLLMLVGGTVGIAGLTGCGTSNGFLSQPEKSYTVTITATSGVLTHSTTTTLTVQ